VPYNIQDSDLCTHCPHGVCVSYIREQSRRMKDRNTLYRLSQKKAMACCYEEWIPGFTTSISPDEPLTAFLEQLVGNARRAGEKLQSQRPNYFGNPEAPFVLTPGQIGKVRGDVSEFLSRAILWNCCVVANRISEHRALPTFPHLHLGLRTMKPLQFKVAIISLGDNYNLQKLFAPRSSRELRTLEETLQSRSLSLSYSTPDLVAVRLDRLDAQVGLFFDTPLESLSSQSQQTLEEARHQLEGRIEAEDVLFACGLKTSIRSDRMYQFLFEANAWKYLWRRAFAVSPCPYHTVVSRSFGANSDKLKSVDFSSPQTDLSRAIDSFALVESPAKLIEWFVRTIGHLS